MKARSRANVAALPVAPWRFPSADPVAATASTFDPTDFIAALAPRLSGIAGQPVDVTAAGASPEPALSAFTRGDGMRVELTVPVDFVAAVVGVRCGGAFVPWARAGAGGAAVAAELSDAVLAAADATWRGRGGWQPAEVVGSAALLFMLTVAGHAFAFACAIEPPPRAVKATADARDWQQRLRGALDATPFAVRAVLHDHMIPLRDALALKVGDVLPIETRRYVSLRLGDRALARGTIGPDDNGGHRVTIVALGDAGVTCENKEMP